MLGVHSTTACYFIRADLLIRSQQLHVCLFHRRCFFLLLLLLLLFWLLKTMAVCLCAIVCCNCWPFISLTSLICLFTFHILPNTSDALNFMDFACSSEFDCSSTVHSANAFFFFFLCLAILSKAQYIRLNSGHMQFLWV